MALVSGIVSPITARHIRNGAVRDIAHLKKKVRGVANNASRQAAGHSRRSFNIGTTELYTGPAQAPFWNMRAEEEFADRMAPKFDETMARTLQKKPREPLTPNPTQYNKTIASVHSARSASKGPLKRPRSPSPMQPARLSHLSSEFPARFEHYLSVLLTNCRHRSRTPKRTACRPGVCRDY